MTRQFVDVYVCAQCGDTLVDNELTTIGRDDCDEGYIKYTIPKEAYDSIKLGRGRAKLARRLGDDAQLYAVQVKVTTTHEASIFVVAETLEEALNFAKATSDWQEDERLLGGVITEDHDYQILGGEAVGPITQSKVEFEFHDNVWGLGESPFTFGHLKDRFW